jgi:putative transposase
LLKAYKVRLDLDESQKVMFTKVFGCYRYCYNNLIAHKEDYYKTNKKSEPLKEQQSWFQHNLLKSEEFLKEFNTNILKHALNVAEDAYSNFFKKNKGKPRFKSKRANQSVKFHKGTCISKNNLLDGKIHLTKNLKDIKFNTSPKYRDFIIANRDCIKNITISKDNTNHYYASILIDSVDNKKAYIQPKNGIDSIIGLDLGIKNFITLSDGMIVENKKFIRNNQDKLSYLQRQLSKKKKLSKNRDKAIIKLAKFHKYIKNCKMDFLHNLSNQITDDNQVIVIEDLKVSNMLKNHKLAKSIQELSIFEFTRQLTYKAEWKGRILIKVDTFYPSSKLCSCCGTKNNELTLKDRIFKCVNPSCGYEIDRDLNASINIKNYGKQMYKDIKAVVGAV